MFWFCLLLLTSAHAEISEPSLDDIWDETNVIAPFSNENSATISSDSLIEAKSVSEALDMKAEDGIDPSANSLLDTTDNIANVKEAAPRFSRAVWDTNNKICLLGFFQATFMITYPGSKGDQTTQVNLPVEATTKGRCAYQHQDPVLELSWTTFRFTITFTTISKAKGDKLDGWAVSLMELVYNTEASMFTGATDGGMRTARSAEGVYFFETPENKSFFCPSPPIIDLYNKKVKAVTLKMQDVRLQPFAITRGKFGTAQKCSLIRIGGTIPEPIDLDETVPIAVGSTLAVMAILTVVGYTFYKSSMFKRVDYNTMT